MEPELKRRGRPALAQASRVFSLKLRLRPGRDDREIALLDETPPGKRAALLRCALQLWTYEGDQEAANDQP